MRVRLDTSVVWYGREYHHGDEIDLPDDVAARYIATHQAEAVVATVTPVEAMMRDTKTTENTMRKPSPQLRRR